MFKLNLKIALRNLWKNKGITAINVGGLSIALAAFILVMMYFTYETSFDKKNPNYDNIYVVGRTFPDFKTNFTPPPLAKAIKEAFAEVVAVGKMKPSGFEFAAFTDQGTVFTKKQLFMEYEAAKMFNITPEGGLEKPNGTETFYYLSKPYMQTLYPNKTDNKPEIVSFGSKAEPMSGQVKGSIVPNPHSNISFDAVSIVNEIGAGESYGYPNYYTYIQVKPGTDIATLESKINTLYQAELKKNGMIEEGENATVTTAFLDPLKNQHLRPKAGNDANYKVLIALSLLGFAILIIACINFTNLSIAQATKRAKEVGVKKVMGAFRYQLTAQFLIEILVQCFIATLLSLVIAEIILPQFNRLFLVDLTIWQIDNDLIWQLPIILVFITLIAGYYPAMVLSGFKPVAVLKGNFQTSRQTYWLRNSLLVTQFSVAVIFITGLLIINSQLKYMRTQDVGFNPNQVLRVKNIVYFNDPEKFAPIKEKILKVPGVKATTVANILPDGSETGSNGYTANGTQASLDFIDVDYDYFETLDIKLKEGRLFSAEFKGDAQNAAILNEAAVARFGLKDPIGKVVRGCNTDYTIVGVIKDFKANGFEKAVEPSIYSINNPCGNGKTEIMIKVDENQMAAVLATLKANWKDINKRDGDNFRYEFLDEMYGKLFKKQEQLQSVFFAAAMLTILIAILGLFAFAKYITNGRIKEIAVRKILGANDLQIFKLLNTSFFYMVMIANIISWPLAYILTKKWLETFVYRVDISALPFIISGLITVLLTIVTVTLQARAAVKANPVNALKYE